MVHNAVLNIVLNKILCAGFVENEMCDPLAHLRQRPDTGGVAPAMPRPDNPTPQSNVPGVAWLDGRSRAALTAVPCMW